MKLTTAISSSIFSSAGVERDSSLSALQGAIPEFVRGLRSDFSLGGLKLAYLVVALNYNHSEAGFRVQYSAWVFLLLAIMSGPKLSKLAPTRAQDRLRTENDSLASLQTATVPSV